MKTKLIRIILTLLLLVAAYIIERTTSLEMWQLLLIYLIPYLVIGYDVLWEAVEGISEGELFDEHFLMSIATIGALCIGFLPGAESQFIEAVSVMLFFQLGELFEGYAEGKSRRAVSHLLEIRPDTAHVLRGGVEQTVSPEEIAIGELVVIKPGERVPLDGFIVDGSSALNTVALTGESIPRSVSQEDEVMSGCINLSGVLTVKVSKTAGESTASKIIEMVEEAQKITKKAEELVGETIPKIENANTLASEIALESEEQSNGIREINNAMQELNNVTQSNSLDSQAMSSSAQVMLEKTERLRTSVEFFQLQ